mgnify:CR=1 FL=1
MNLRTLWIPSWYPHKGQLFYGSFVYRQALATSQFCEIAVLYVIESEDTEMVMEETQINSNFFQLIIYIPKNKWRIGKFVQLMQAYRSGWKRLKELNKKPQITHLHVVYPSGVFALWLHWIQQIPFVISEHWTGYRKAAGDFKGWFLKGLIGQSIKQSKRVITVSNQASLAMQQHGLAGDYMVLPNVVDVKNAPKKPAKFTEKCHFIHVSSLEDRHKNITGLLTVLKELTKVRKDFFLEIIGGNPVAHREYFEQKVREMDLESHVQFTGLIPNEQMLSRLAAADVFVLFSNFEGLPCSMLEAMAVGLPVITTEIGDMNKWVTEEVGRLIEICDEAALLTALIHMLDHHQTYDGEKIRKRIIDTCGYEVVGKKIVSIYEEVLETNLI